MDEEVIFGDLRRPSSSETLLAAFGNGGRLERFTLDEIRELARRALALDRLERERERWLAAAIRPGSRGISSPATTNRARNRNGSTSGVEGSDEITITKAQARYVSWVSEVLLDIVVLNLFVEYVHTIVIDSFAISVLTALLMKLAIDAVKGLEHRVATYFRTKQGLVWRAIGLVSVFSILFLSKFVILELVNIVFGDHVELGHFIEIVAIILTMLVGSALLRLVFRQLGRHTAPGR